MTNPIDKALEGGITSAALRERYESLCAVRDSINEQAAPLQSQLDAANQRANEIRDEAMRLAAQIQEIRGGEKWIELKKEIGLLANALSGRRQ